GDTALDVIQQSDGKLVVAGTRNWYVDAGLWRFLPDGKTDLEFGEAGSVTLDLGVMETASQVLQLPDGKLIVAGTLDEERLMLARFDANGRPDPDFGTLGALVLDLPEWNRWTEVTALLQSADGALTVVGHTYGYLAVVRVRRDGSLDARFGSGGIVTIAASSINDAHVVTWGGSAALLE